MSAETISTRRDKRLRLRPGSASIEFRNPLAGEIPSKGIVTDVSVSGLGFEVEGEEARFRTGVGLERVVIRIGACELEGDALVRNVRSTHPRRVAVGCLFYPAARQEDRWTTLMTGEARRAVPAKRGVTIRCAGCLGAVWLPPVADASPMTAACGTCERQYSLHASVVGETAGRALPEKAHRLAKEHAIDLPSAYSVLLGIMSIDDLYVPYADVLEEDGSRKRPYDAAFQPAIDEGLLTPRQAAERGRREAYARILATRHGLSHGRALRVADNRISLPEAIREREKLDEQRGTRPDASPQRSARTALLAGALGVAGLIALLAGGRGQISSELSTPGRTYAIGAAEIHTDARGRVVEVLGPDPRSVLRAYCVAGATVGRLQALDVVPSAQPGSRARLGLLRDPRRPEELLAISILEDREARHWRAGDGSGPLRARPAPPGAERAVRER